LLLALLGNRETLLLWKENIWASHWTERMPLRFGSASIGPRNRSKCSPLATETNNERSHYFRRMMALALNTLSDDRGWMVFTQIRLRAVCDPGWEDSVWDRPETFDY